MLDIESGDMPLEVLPDPHVVIDGSGAVLAATPHFDRRILEDPRILAHLATVDDVRVEFSTDIDGRRRVLSASWMPCTWRGTVARIVRLLDVTDERTHAEAVEASMHTLEDVLDALPASLLIVNGEGRIISGNARWHILARANGLMMPEAGIHANYLDVCDRSAAMGDADAIRVAQGLRDVLSRRALAFDMEYSLSVDGGTPRWFFLGINALGAHPGAIIQHYDVTDIHREQEERYEALAHFKAVFDGALDGIVIFNDDLRVLSRNAAAASMVLPRETDGVSRSLLDLVVVEDHERLFLDRELLLTAGEVRGQLRLRSAQEQVVEVEYAARASVVPGRHVAVLRDITASRRLEAQLRQSQKMEALGQLTGGIAHDFNNLLTVIHAQSDLLLSDDAVPPDMREGLQHVLQASQRGADMVRKLMAFGRREQLRAVPVQLDDAVQEVCGMLRRLLPETITVDVQAEKCLPSVRADATALQQILLNLATNARDAMRDRGGELRVTIGTADIDTSSPSHPSRSGRLGVHKPGVHRYVTVEVTDTGCGMSSDVLAHIFEPFFTTKRQGEGTGLGMSMVYGLMDQMGGYVTVDSQLHSGTRVRLFFPAMRMSHPTPASIAALPGRHDSGTEHILLVEDDHDIRALTARVLRRAGYEVTEAVSGEDAEQLLRNRIASGAPSFALVVSDMVMPHGDGMYVLEATRRLAAPARIVWVSGYAGDGLFGMRERSAGENGQGMSADPVHSHAVAPIIQKPWTTSEFLSRIRAVLDAPPNVQSDATATHVPFRAG